ncbi:hypothetical protein [Mycobacterium sp. ITM-2016-00318]|uniref:hypothetical protein n=1 Tax=Mycobacterium sp. ITM-2016-00318 TaxID=2099693 RepID=UPI0011575B88|nr:hypothetical protein [Mycobacterium sp. ITM-2016-00318]WNG93565.1 hypothetical protein C6A82_003550 [Mycobacterium sp. ITM-2016-00318]
MSNEQRGPNTRTADAKIVTQVLEPGHSDEEFEQNPDSIGWTPPLAPGCGALMTWRGGGGYSIIG